MTEHLLGSDRLFLPVTPSQGHTVIVPQKDNEVTKWGIFPHPTQGTQEGCVL